MKLIVGLGNSGRTYKYNRHNIGFLVIDNLTKSLGIKMKRDLTTRSYLGQGKIQDKDVILARPLCFMNLAGLSVSLLLKKYKLKPHEDMLVVFDDLDLAWGEIRIKPRGSSGGHNGIKSIISSLGSSDFTRLRMGIGRPRLSERLCKLRQQKRIIDYVLRNLTRKEKKQLSEYLESAAKCCTVWVSYGINKAMNEFN